MGAWSILAAGWLPLPAVFGLKIERAQPRFCHRNKNTVEALFLEYQEAAGAVHAPEVFPGRTTLPMSHRTLVRSSACRRCVLTCRPRSARDSILVRQACYRPMTQDGPR
jgi:hypothetical protein